MAETSSSKPVLSLLLKADFDKILTNELSSIPKEKRLRLIEPLARFIRRFKVLIKVNSSVKISQIVEAAYNEKKIDRLTVGELISLHRSFAMEPGNIAECAAVDPAYRDTWKEILNSPEISNDRIEKILGRCVHVENSRYWRSDFYVETLFHPLVVVAAPYLSYYSTDNDLKHYVFSISPDNRAKLANVIFGENMLKPVVVDQIPDGKKMVIESFEQSMGSDFTFLKSLMQSDALSYLNPVTVSKLKALQKSFSTPTFHAADPEKELNRLQLLINSFFRYSHFIERQGHGVKQGLGGFAKFVADELPSYIHATWFNMFFINLKGFTKSWADSSYIGYVTGIIHSMLKEAPEGWMSMENIQIRYLCTSLPKTRISSYIHLFSSQARERHALRNNFGAAIDIGTLGWGWFYQVDFPFVIGWLKLLCAVGIIEIAKDPEADPLEDILQGIRYVRLTPLGRYALRLAKFYEPPVVSTGNELEVEDEQGIITIVSDSSPYEFILNQIARPIGRKRFKVSVESIMSGCNSADMVTSRIDTIKKIVDLDTNPKFRLMIESVKKRLDSAIKLPGDYVLYRISHEVPELAELIMGDPRMSGNVLPSLGGKLFVKRSFVPDFKMICAQKGFFIQ